MVLVLDSASRSKITLHASCNTWTSTSLHQHQLHVRRHNIPTKKCQGERTTTYARTRTNERTSRFHASRKLLTCDDRHQSAVFTSHWVFLFTVHVMISIGFRLIQQTLNSSKWKKVALAVHTPLKRPKTEPKPRTNNLLPTAAAINFSNFSNTQVYGIAQKTFLKQFQ
eukprot:gnl/MRDRNA2_/MRDRNA2_53989_c0_seq1.p1 gnl/MRDRNA2_/MRDRNA2_53989_c0~~gnl/MRDRNA2_/MRDRNA2_53989_c0_seq1.p1  ORF type:complete len:168 (+),score=13.80 gnl/MRDRNA2_/MRDRNA2_53989_c0_seq1:158-661(+)